MRTAAPRSGTRAATSNVATSPRSSNTGVGTYGRGAAWSGGWSGRRGTRRAPERAGRPVTRGEATVEVGARRERRAHVAVLAHLPPQRRRFWSWRSCCCSARSRSPRPCCWPRRRPSGPAGAAHPGGAVTVGGRIPTMYDSERYFFEALRAGASGYVLKSVADLTPDALSNRCGRVLPGSGRATPCPVGARRGIGRADPSATL